MIKTKTDGNGTIEAVNNALGNKTIQFKITSNKGYKLKSIVITTDSGEEVEFNKGEITKNNDGTLSIDKNKFTMPFKNVTIQAKFITDSLLKNPKTRNELLIVALVTISVMLISTFIYKKKEYR